MLQQIWYYCWQIEQIVVYQSKGEVTGETSQKHYIIEFIKIHDRVVKDAFVLDAIYKED